MCFLDTLEVLLQILPVAQAVAQRVRGRGLHVFVHATGRGEPRVWRTELQPRPAGGASATAHMLKKNKSNGKRNGSTYFCAVHHNLIGAPLCPGRQLHRLET